MTTTLRHCVQFVISCWRHVVKHQRVDPILADPVVKHQRVDPIMADPIVKHQRVDPIMVDPL